MTEENPDLTATLDAEYREFVRSLHSETIAAVSLVDNWWNYQARMHVIFGMSGNPKPDAVEKLDEQWRGKIRKALTKLINGHPDPAVRDAADYFDARLVGAMVLIHRRPDDFEPPAKEGNPDKNQVDSFTLRLVDQGLYNLLRAAYHAPFRVNRPEPEWDGIRIGNSEGMPSDILKLIEERGEHYQG